MIIYYAMTKYHLIFSIVHKLKMHKEDEAILFVYSGLQDLNTNYSRLKETRYFKDIYVVPEIEFRKNWTPLGEDASNDEIINNIQGMVELIEEWLPIPISKEDELYIANDHWAIGTYCIFKKIPYVYYEDGVGMLSKPDYSYELVKKLNATHATMAKYMKAFGLNECVKYKLADLENQSDGFYDEKAVHFSLKENLQSLKSEDMSRLLYIFNAPNCGDAQNATILLTEHFVNMKRLTIEGQRELYAILVDFFAMGDTLFVKPHPNDFQISYVDLFKNAKMISRIFPSELLPYCFENKLKLALAACSTSVYGLKNVVNDTLRFDIDIENHYMYIFKYYALSLVSKILDDYNIIEINTYRDLLDAFNIHYRSDGDSIKGKKLVVIDDKNTQMEVSAPKMVDSNILVYINSSEQGKLFQEKKLNNYKKNCVIIQITVNSNLDTKVINNRREYIYIYTVDKGVKEKLISLKKEKKMEYCGAILDVEALTDDREMQVKLLEGNLKAANYRIEKYKEEEVMYKNEIEELKEKLKKRDEEILDNLKIVLNNERNGEK